MATKYSDQRTARLAVPSRRVKPNEWHGRIRIGGWTYTVPVGDDAVATVIELVDIPIGARLLGGEIAAEAMSTGGGAASVQIGIVGTVAKYLATTTVDTAAVALIGNTIALGFMEELTAEITLIATVTTEAWAAGKLFKGYMRYVVD